MQVAYPNAGPMSNIFFAAAIKLLTDTHKNKIANLSNPSMEVIYHSVKDAYEFILSADIRVNDLTIRQYSAHLIKSSDILNAKLHPRDISDVVFSDMLEKLNAAICFSIAKHYTQINAPVAPHFREIQPYEYINSGHDEFKKYSYNPELSLEVRKDVPEGEYKYEGQSIYDKIGGKSVKIVFKPQSDMTAYELFMCLELLKLTTVRGSKMAFITDHELNRHWEVQDGA